MDRDAVEEFIETQDKANGLDTKVKMEASSDGGSMRSSKGIQLQVTPTKVNPSRSESHPLKEDAVISAGEREEKGKENRIRRSNTWKRRSLITPLMSPEQKQQQQQLQLQQLQQQQQQQSGKNGDMSWTPLGRNRRNTGECSDGQQSVRSSIGSINSAMLEKVDTDLALTLPFETSGQEVSGQETSNLNANNNSNNINNQGQGQGQGHGLDLNSNQSQSQNNISTGNRSPSNAEDVDALLQSLANKELEILERTRKMHDLFRQIKAEDRMIQQTAAELQQLKKKVSELVGTGHQYEKNYSMSRGNSTSSGNSGIAANQSKKPASLWSKSVSLLSQFDQMIQGTMETKLRMMDAESGEQSETTSEASEVSGPGSGPGSGPKKREQESAVAPTSSIWSLVNEFKQGLGLVGIEEEEEADGTPTTASTTTDADSSSKHSQHVTGDVEMHAL